MKPSERELLDKLRQRIEQLTCGENAPVLETPEECDEDVKSLIGAFNRYISLVDEARCFVAALASGNLKESPPPRNQVAAPFKQLHAALQHLTWQTGQVAQGDYSQRVHFLGEFSESFNSMVEALSEKERTEAALREARSQVRNLEGVIPICMYCKKIRDDADSWQQLERYISEHSEALFSHGICPTCFEDRFNK
ncbi:MAG: hypothetical protein A2X82_01915 [Geobacteraceae bacterium GWC2_55_20]|nr:MAG: hypothetical protein A2X82_01915 [Geobacteraceae bacterium GWC2_55_20]OGU26280.1 MAG: hypothetical protein A2X85_12670 [Geobacteraceae bacterium GWF2_54_21]